AHAARRRMIRHDAMQKRAPDSVSGSAWKRSLGFCSVAHETNAAKWIRFALGNRDAELAQGLHSVRHQSLAAGLVDRRNRAIRHHHAQTVTARCDSCRQPGRSAADYEYIPRIRKTFHHDSLIGQISPFDVPTTTLLPFQ